MTAPPNSQATASDANGDYVVAWNSDGGGSGAGLYAKVYEANWTTSASGVRTSNPSVLAVTNPSTGSPWLNNEIMVTPTSGGRTINVNGTSVTVAFTSASNPSVGMDGTGDFVVTWSEQDTEPANPAMQSPDWNVWAQRYNAAGNPVGAAFMVNTTTADVQRVFGRGDGRRGRLHHRLAEPRPGRQRLRHLCRALRPGRQ